MNVAVPRLASLSHDQKSGHGSHSLQHWLVQGIPYRQSDACSTVLEPKRKMNPAVHNE